MDNDPRLYALKLESKLQDLIKLVPTIRKMLQIKEKSVKIAEEELRQLISHRNQHSRVLCLEQLKVDKEDLEQSLNDYNKINSDLELLQMEYEAVCKDINHSEVDNNKLKGHKFVIKLTIFVVKNLAPSYMGQIKRESNELRELLITARRYIKELSELKIQVRTSLYFNTSSDGTLNLLRSFIVEVEAIIEKRSKVENRGPEIHLKEPRGREHQEAEALERRRICLAQQLNRSRNRSELIISLPIQEQHHEIVEQSRIIGQLELEGLLISEKTIKFSKKYGV